MSLVTVLSKLPTEEFKNLYNMLEKITLHKTSDIPNCSYARTGMPIHRTLLFGLIRKRRVKGISLSADSIKYPHIFDELLRIGDAIVPFEFTSIHVVKNLICPQHRDKHNVGDSLIVAFGEYTGCNLVVEGIAYNTNCQPIMFNGSQLLHWNIPDLVGTKYSVIFYKAKN